jgi:hypothetical protein
MKYQTILKKEVKFDDLGKIGVEIRLGSELIKIEVDSVQNDSHKAATDLIEKIANTARRKIK